MGETDPHLEGKIWSVLWPVLFLWLDRTFQRLFIVVFVTVPIGMTFAPDRSGIVIVGTYILASLWGLIDLARGIEIDHQHKERTLRDSVLEAWNEE